MLASEGLDLSWLSRSYKLNTKVASSSTQGAIIESCMSTPAAADGYCATWVSNVYANAKIGGVVGNADDLWAEAYCYTSDSSKLQPGMIIAVNSTGYSGEGYLYGHVGIYVGDNIVMHSTRGVVVTNTLSNWITIYDT